jgi:hypothetical protein
MLSPWEIRSALLAALSEPVVAVESVVAESEPPPPHPAAASASAKAGTAATIRIRRLIGARK